MTNTRIGVLGGSFDPIHLGHLHIAQRTQRLFRLSTMHFVVATYPPHKSAKGLSGLNDRFAMVCLATAGFANFIPSLVELEPPASAFSIHTMRKLARAGGPGNVELYFIAGTDSLMEISTWRASKELLSSYKFVFVERPGVEIEVAGSFLPRSISSQVLDLRGLGPRQLVRRIRSVEKLERSRVYIIKVGALDISSSQIRSLASSRKRISHLLPASVHEYIRKLHIYGER